MCCGAGCTRSVDVVCCRAGCMWSVDVICCRAGCTRSVDVVCCRAGCTRSVVMTAVSRCDRASATTRTWTGGPRRARCVTGEPAGGWRSSAAGSTPQVTSPLRTSPPPPRCPGAGRTSNPRSGFGRSSLSPKRDCLFLHFSETLMIGFLFR